MFIEKIKKNDRKVDIDDKLSSNQPFITLNDSKKEKIIYSLLKK